MSLFIVCMLRHAQIANKIVEVLDETYLKKHLMDSHDFLRVQRPSSKLLNIFLF